MTTWKRKSRWLAATLAVMALMLLFAAVPAYAAGQEADTGETEASVSFTAGQLRLESAPTLDFGAHAISHEAQEYPAVTTGDDVVVSDLRGNAEGWTLFASLSPFQLEEEGGDTLKAASIRFTLPRVNAENGTIGTAPGAEETITLPSDATETRIFTAQGGQGMGVWSLGWDAANIVLAVKPGTAQDGRSTAALTWSLQSAP
ncbi:WxL domain-containing protein [Ruminococcaceae bacterium OttesenSCG-928-O06]|nr:WxL domain-containing protein [Ruminococcaceae bacterium OttesenSCG-928-O06]